MSVLPIMRRFHPSAVNILWRKDLGTFSLASGFFVGVFLKELFFGAVLAAIRLLLLLRVTFLGGRFLSAFFFIKPTRKNRLSGPAFIARLIS